jgi:probable HAF family extracellular repeat protein
MKTYKLVDLTAASGAPLLAESFNDAGIVVGTVGADAVRYCDCIQVLPTPGDTVQATPSSVAGRNPELIVGFRVAPVHSAEGECSVAAMWRDGQYVDLHAQLNASRSGAHDVNEDGVVVGWVDGSALRFDTRTGAVEILGVGSANAINARGNVAGITSAPARPLTRAYLYDGTLTLLPTLGGELYPAPLDLNSDDVVVGTSETEDAERHAFLYDHRTRTITDLHRPGYSASQAWHINDRREVVGHAEESGIEVAVIWQPGETMRKLVDLVIDAPRDLRIARAVHINDKSEILVIGELGGEERSFLLVPARSA